MTPFKIYKTIILPVVLYRCETLSLTIREEHRLRVFENRVLRRIFGPKRDEVSGGWRKLHNEELYALNRVWLPTDETSVDIDRSMHDTLYNILITRLTRRYETGSQEVSISLFFSVVS
jgi:hypothetical protein